MNLIWKLSNHYEWFHIKIIFHYFIKKKSADGGIRTRECICTPDLKSGAVDRLATSAKNLNRYFGRKIEIECLIISKIILQLIYPFY